MARPDDLLPSTLNRIAIIAERRPRLAVRLAQAAFAQAPDDPWAAFALGWAFLCWERAADARPLLTRVADYFHHESQTLAALHCRHLLLLADAWETDYPGLDIAFADLGEQFMRLGAALPAARALLDQARQLNLLGRPMDAIKVLERIELQIAGGSAPDRIRWLRTRAVAAIQQGEYTFALSRLEQSMQLAASRGYHIEVAHARVEWARSMLRQERLDDALAAYRAAERVYGRHDLPLRLAFSARNIGITLMMQGRYDQALASLLQAQRAFTALRRKGELGSLQLILGNIHYFTARWDAALGHYLRAEALLNERGMIGDALVARRNRAMVYRQQRRRSQARRLLDEVEARRQELGDASELAEITSIRAGLFADEQRWRAARELYQRAAEAFERLGNAAAAAECTLEQAWIAIRTQQYATAATLFAAIGAALDDRPHHRWRVEYGLARCYHAEDRMDAALQWFGRAIETVGGLRQSLKSEHAASALAQQSAELYHDAAACALSIGDLKQLLAFTEASRATVLRRLAAEHQPATPAGLDEVYERLRRTVARNITRRNLAPGPQLDALLDEYGELLVHSRNSAPPATAPAGAPFNLADIRQILAGAFGDDWTILSYVTIANQIAVVMMTPSELLVETTPNDEMLHRLITRVADPQSRGYLFEDAPFALRRSKAPWQTLHDLAERLIPAQARRRLHPAHRLLLIPSGPLHTIPWATLRIDDSWLAERAIIQLLPSFAMLEHGTPRHAPHKTSNLLIGCSVTKNRADVLPAVTTEVRLIERRLGGDCAVLLNSGATRDALLQHSRNGALLTIDILHFACHAMLIPRQGLAAHLALWDDIVLLPDIVRLRLDGALAVLSACDGATPDALPGDEVLSLNWAFLIAGARGVVASQWAVRDDTVPLIMDVFYAALVENRDPAYALAIAQRRLIAAEPQDQVVVSPEQWGAFVYTGRSLPDQTTPGSSTSRLRR